MQLLDPVGGRIMVAHILACMRMDLVTIETGLLHDLVEDTRMTPDEIRKGFGDEVARCVDGVTKLSKLDIFNAEERQAESFRKMLLAMVDDIRVIIVKLADRRAHVATETIEIYAPIAPPRYGQSARRVGRLGLPASGSGSLRGDPRHRRERAAPRRHSETVRPSADLQNPDRPQRRIWRYAGRVECDTLQPKAG